MIARRVAAALAACAMVAGACAYRAEHSARPSIGATIQARAGDRYEVIYSPATGKYTAEAKDGGPSYTCEPGNRSATAAFSVEVDGREVDCADN